MPRVTRDRVRETFFCEKLLLSDSRKLFVAKVFSYTVFSLSLLLKVLQSKLSALASQRAQLQASLQTRNPQSHQYQKERQVSPSPPSLPLLTDGLWVQVYQDGIMGVAAVLAGLRSTLKSGTDSYQKQKELMTNNDMMLSVSQWKFKRMLHFCNITFFSHPPSLSPFLPPSLPPSLPPESKDRIAEMYGQIL